MSIFFRIYIMKNQVITKDYRHAQLLCKGWRRKLTISVCNTIRERIVTEIDGGESFFCIDSKPIEVCCITKSSRCRLWKSDYETAPSFGYCASTMGTYCMRFAASAESSTLLIPQRRTCTILTT